jgi:hypothetical protein
VFGQKKINLSMQTPDPPSSRETSTVKPTDPTNNVTFFRKKSRLNKNVRKRKQSSPEGSSDEAGKSAVVTKERRSNSPFVQISRKERQKSDNSLKFSSNKQAASRTGQDNATSAELDTEFDRDAQALLEERVFAAEDVSEFEGRYHYCTSTIELILHRICVARLWMRCISKSVIPLLEVQ